MLSIFQKALKRLCFGCLLIVVAACGGGGGGSSGGGGSNNSSSGGGGSNNSSSPPPAISSGNLAALVPDTTMAMQIGMATEVATSLFVDRPGPTTMTVTRFGGGCFSGHGTAVFFLTNDASGNVTGSGTYTNFDNCAGFTLNGTTTSVTGKINLSDNSLDHFDFTFTNLSYTPAGQATSLRLSGTIHLVLKPFSPGGPLPYQMTIDATLFDQSNRIVFSLESYFIDSVVTASRQDVVLSGRISDPALGSADVFTPSRLTVLFPSTGPSSGKLTLTGSTEQALVNYPPGSTTAGPIPVSQTLADSSFGANGKVTTDFGGGRDFGAALVVQADGKLVAAGTARPLGGTEFALARYLPNGSLDSSFGVNGKVTTAFGGDDTLRALLIQPDGKLVAAGSASWPSNFALVRYNADGSLDTGFGTGGKVQTAFDAFGHYADASALVRQPDGKLVAAGSFFDGVHDNFALARYNADGSLDLAFGSNGLVVTPMSQAGASSLLVQPDGKLLAAGTSSPSGGRRAFTLVRYNADGSIDTGFGTVGKVQTPSTSVNAFITDVVLQPDGKLVAAGLMSDGSGNAITLVRYNVDGSFDSSFGAGGTASVIANDGSSGAGSLVSQNGKFVVVGATPYGLGSFTLVRFNADGTLDASFGVNGIVLTPFAGGEARAAGLVAQTDGKLVAMGSYSGATWDFALVRYLP